MDKLIPNIISSENRTHDRLPRLMNDLVTQGIKEFKIWPAILDRKRCTGISRAHKQIIRWAKEEKMPMVLVFEDDIRWAKEDAHEYFISKMPEGDWDIYLGGCYNTYWSGEKFNSKLLGFIAMHCYIVKEKFYDTFLSLPEDMDIDRALNGKGDFELCYPFACVQYAGWSDNAMQVCDYDFLLAGIEVYGAETITSK